MCRCAMFNHAERASGFDARRVPSRAAMFALRDGATFDARRGASGAVPRDIMRVPQQRSLSQKIYGAQAQRYGDAENHADAQPEARRIRA